MTGNVLITCHSYKVERVKKQYSVYQLTEVLQTDNLFHFISEYTVSETIKKGYEYRKLTELIRIEKDRHFHQAASNLIYWLRLRTNTNWQKCKPISGLFKTELPGVFYGDYIYMGKKHLLIAQISSDFSHVDIDMFLNYCPYSKPELITPELEAILSKYGK